MGKEELARLAQIFREASTATNPIQAAALQSLPLGLSALGLCVAFDATEFASMKIVSNVLAAIAGAYQRAADEYAPAARD